MDPSILEVFERRNRDTKKEEGGVATLMAMRRTEEGERKPTHSDVTWQMDIMDMSTRGTTVGNQYSYALLCVDIGTRRVRGQLLKTRTGKDVTEAFQKMREGEGHIPKVLDTDKDTAFMSEEFQDYLRRHKIQHVTKDVMADNQLSLVDSKMGQLKKEMFMQMVKDADAEARIHGISSWSEWLRQKPDAKEPDWHTYFTEAVKTLNRKPLNYLMGQSVKQTFDDDGRPRRLEATIQKK